MKQLSNFSLKDCLDFKPVFTTIPEDIQKFVEKVTRKSNENKTNIKRKITMNSYEVQLILFFI